MNNGSLFNSFYFITFTQIYSIFLYTSCGLTTLIFVLISFVVVKKSTKEMQVYKWYLAHHIWWSYCFCLSLTMFQPMPLFSLDIAFVGGWTKIFGSIGGFVQMEVLSVTGYATYISLLLSLLYRYSQVVFSPFSIIFTKPKITILVHIFVLIIGIVIILYLLIHARPKIDSLKTLIWTKYGIDDQTFEQLAIFGYEQDTLNPNIYIFIILALLFSMINVVLLVYILVDYAKVVKKMPVLCNTSYRLKQMLYRTIIFQFTIFFNLLILPLGVVMICVILRYKNATYLAMPLWIIASTHASADFICVLYFVRPYKRYCLYLLKRICCRAIPIEHQPETLEKWKLQFNVIRAAVNLSPRH